MWQLALMAAGLLLRGFGQSQANAAQADEERLNASFYREQAEYAEDAGIRQREIFDRESQVLYGEQMSSFAKAGVDTSSSSNYMASQILTRQRESFAIKREADMNVRLAMLRSESSDRTAKRLEDPSLIMSQILGGGLQLFGGK
jgi:hypothetical protein